MAGLLTKCLASVFPMEDIANISKITDGPISNKPWNL